MIYNNLSCAISSKIHLFAILCNNLSYNLTFLQSFLNESRQDVKYVGLMAGTFLPPHFLVSNINKVNEKLTKSIKKLNHNKIVIDSLLQVVRGREAIHL